MLLIILKILALLNFSYLTKFGPILITEYSEYYQYYNIICMKNKSISITNFIMW